MRYCVTGLRLAMGVLAVLPIGVHGAAKAEMRVASLNLCTDEILLRVADPSQVASVTWLSRDENSSSVSALARHVPVNHGTAEEILMQQVDLVLAGDLSARHAVNLLRRLGKSVMVLPAAVTSATIAEQIIAVSRAIGRAENGTDLVARMTTQLAEIVSPDGRLPRPKALIVNPNGFTTGAGTLADAILKAAGFENLAVRLGRADYHRLPIETIVTSGADILILNADRDGPPALATELLRHPAFAHAYARAQVVILPSRHWTCGFAMAEAVEYLTRLRRTLQSRSAAP
ncbi:MAG: ABC transporter substrate-binding protein [Proteobacteria bacterium]|nr:ABC transporter substrate-binding protein [Pseudomonadota bacterium]